MKTIGVLTSGGDAPGMNAAIRSVVRTACENGMRVMGIRRGYNGLMQGDMYEMNLRSVSNVINRGGTFLYSARSPEFKTEEGLQKALNVAKEVGLDGIVVIGGDGSFRGARDLSLRGLPCVGVPGTIDNDIACSDYTIGYDTAMNTVLEMVDRLRDTCESHARCNVVEVMGRNAGYIALECGIASGATGIAIGEIPFNKEELINRIEALSKKGRRHFIIIASEGLGATYTEELATDIQKITGIDTRFARLAHVQRGGRPTNTDRVTATLMGDKAVDLLVDGKYNLVVCQKKGQSCAVEMEYAFALDRIVKGKATEEEILKHEPEYRAKLLAEAEEIKANMNNLYDVAKIMSL